MSDAATTTAPAAEIVGLADAIRAAAPHADAKTWSAALTPHLVANDITAPRRIAAFLGQCAIESQGFTRLEENLRYTHADRLHAVFPSAFPTEEDALPFMGRPEALANHVYANRLGNGDEASGDGWLFRGGGLIMLTARAGFAAFARDMGSPVEQVAAWVRTPDGAAASAAWYWRTRKLNAAADAWDLAAVTRGVNGKAMLAHAERVAASNAALSALGGR